MKLSSFNRFEQIVVVEHNRVSSAHMVSECTQRRIETLLDGDDAAIVAGGWFGARIKAEEMLDLDPESADAPALVAAASQRMNRGRSGGFAEPPSVASEALRERLGAGFASTERSGLASRRLDGRQRVFVMRVR